MSRQVQDATVLNYSFGAGLIFCAIMFVLSGGMGVALNWGHLAFWVCVFGILLSLAFRGAAKHVLPAKTDGAIKPARDSEVTVSGISNWNAPRRRRRRRRRKAKKH